ncbi:MAG: hypothetical protein AAFW60_07995 [Pseudomonadota bacterium]
MQRRLGNQLSQTVLRKAIGETDFAHLHSETVFGPVGPHLQLRLPYMLAFGHELGLGFRRLQGKGNNAESIARLAALFNVGVSLFDLLHDSFPDLASMFSSYFDGELLERSIHNPDGMSSLKADIECVPEPELRILLRIITAFFDGVRRSRRGRPIPERLGATLSEAYRMEILSLSAGHPKSLGKASEISRAKSTMPFIVIRELARVRSSKTREKKTDAAALQIGEIFWLLDDIVDLVADVRQGALNSVLVSAGNLNPESNAADVGSVLAALLESSILEDVADRLVDLITLQRENLSETGGDLHLFQMVCAYARDWID